jgi:hypothetical protein
VKNEAADKMIGDKKERSVWTLFKFAQIIKTNRSIYVIIVTEERPPVRTEKSEGRDCA